MKERENFGSRMAVIMAFAGSAIGLGNIWRFPYLVGQDGGAAFVVIYVLATLIISLPIFFAESVVGRRTGANCRGAFISLGKGTAWPYLGFLMVFTPLWIVSYYSVVGGWSLEYLVQALRLDYIHTSPETMSGSFERFISRTWAPLGFHLAFLAVTVTIVALGVKSGIEKFSKICLPILFALVVLIAVYSLTLPGAQKGVAYLFKPNFSKVTIGTCLDALGQSFYSLSLGMGIIITYSSYVSKKENLMASGAGTAVSDLLFAILAGVAIMPAVFAAGIEPGSGPGLIFDTLPYIFDAVAQFHRRHPVLRDHPVRGPHLVYFPHRSRCGIPDGGAGLQARMGLRVPVRRYWYPWRPVQPVLWPAGGREGLRYGFIRPVRYRRLQCPPHGRRSPGGPVRGLEDAQGRCFR